MAAAARPHARQHLPGQRDQSEDVGLELRPDMILLALLDRREIAVAGIVHEHVDTAEPRLCLGDRRGDVLPVGNVEPKR